MAAPQEPSEGSRKESRLNDENLRHIVDREYVPYSDAWHYKNGADEIYERARRGRMDDDPHAYYQEYERLRRKRRRPIRSGKEDNERRPRNEDDPNHDGDRESRHQRNRSAYPGAAPHRIEVNDPNRVQDEKEGEKGADAEVDDPAEQPYEDPRAKTQSANGRRTQERDLAEPDNDRMGAWKGRRRQGRNDDQYEHDDYYPGVFLYNQRPSRHASQGRSRYDYEESSAHGRSRHGSRHGSKRHSSTHHRSRSRSQSSGRSVRLKANKPKYSKGRAPSVEPAKDPYRPKEKYTILKAAKAASWAGLVEGIRCRSEPGPWSGQKGKRVLCAASVATVIGALRNGQNQSAGRMPYAEALMTGFYATDFMKRVGRNTKHQENAYVEQRKWREEHEPEERKKRQVKRHQRRSARQKEYESHDDDDDDFDMNEKPA